MPMHRFLCLIAALILLMPSAHFSQQSALRASTEVVQFSDPSCATDTFSWLRSYAAQNVRIKI